MRQLYNIQQVQPAQKHMHEPLVTRQEMPKHASYSGKVQKKHRVLNGGTPPSQHKSKHKKRHKARKKLKCIQLNLQHSRLATDNLIKTIEEENIDILCLQEPYEIRNKTAGMPRRLKIFTSGEGKHRAATIVDNNHIDTILKKQLSDEDAVVMETISRDLKMIIASMSFDITRHIQKQPAKDCKNRTTCKRCGRTNSNRQQLQILLVA